MNSEQNIFWVIFFVFYFQGALTAGVISFSVNFWLSIGSMGIDLPNRRLPPAPMYGCEGNETVYYNYTMADYTVDPEHTL